jgi:hypothetical protein
MDTSVRARAAEQDSSGAGIKKELPIGTTFGNIPKTIGSSNI